MTGGVYDEEERIAAAACLAAKSPHTQCNAMGLTEDYMDFAEEYLASIDATSGSKQSNAPCKTGGCS